MARLNEIAVVLLAAGRGERFGANKLRAELDGRPIAYHAPSRLAALPFGQRIAVVGAGTPDLTSTSPWWLILMASRGRGSMPTSQG